MARASTAVSGTGGGAVAALAFATAAAVTTEFVVVGLLPWIARDLGMPVAEAGWLVTWFALGSALLGPPLTAALGRASPRGVLALSMGVIALGNLATAWLPHYGLAVAVRIVQGAALPVLVSIGSAAVAERAGPGREGRTIARVYLGVVAANVAAVPAGVAIAECAGWAASFLGLAAISATATVALWLAFPGTPMRKAPPAVQARVMLAHPVQAHLLLSALLFAAMFIAYSYLAAFLERVAGYGADRVAAALAGFGLAGVAGNWLAGRWAGRGATATTAVVAAILMLVLAFAAGAATTDLLLPLLAVWGAAHAAAFLACQVRVMQAAPTAAAFGASLNISACNIGIAAGAAIGAGIVARWDVRAVGFGAAAVAGAALVVALTLCLVERRRPAAAT